MTRHIPWTAAALGLALLGACSKKEPEAAPQPAPTATPAAQPTAAAVVPKESAEDVFKNRCVPCHGQSGKGDGAAAAALNPKPRDYTDSVWQKSVTDEQIRKAILYGGAAVGKSAVMPSQPDLESKPEVLDGLIKLIRGFGAA